MDLFNPFFEIYLKSFYTRTFNSHPTPLIKQYLDEWIDELLWISNFKYYARRRESCLESHKLGQKRYFPIDEKNY